MISTFSKIILISGNFFLIVLISIYPKRIREDKFFVFFNIFFFMYFKFKVGKNSLLSFPPFNTFIFVVVNFFFYLLFLSKRFLHYYFFIEIFEFKASVVRGFCINSIEMRFYSLFFLFFFLFEFFYSFMKSFCQNIYYSYRFFNEII